LETYNYELSGSNIVTDYQASELADADGDGTPAKEDADANDPNIGRLIITIERPFSGEMVH
jgi:hypothetical protein